MPTSRKLVVHTGKTITEQELEKMRGLLRAMRPLGVRFSEEKVDQGPVTINAWIETPEPRPARAPRQALGAGAAEDPSDRIHAERAREAAAGGV